MTVGQRMTSPGTAIWSADDQTDRQGYAADWASSAYHQPRKVSVMSAEQLIEAWKNVDYWPDDLPPVEHPAGDAQRELYVSAGERTTCNAASMTCMIWCSCL